MTNMIFAMKWLKNILIKKMINCINNKFLLMFICCNYNKINIQDK